MKIQISSIDNSGCYGYNIYDLTTGHTVHKMTGMRPRDFDESELEIILSDKQLTQFENGKYEFDVTGKTLSLIDDYYYKPSFSLDRNYLKLKAVLS